MKNAGFYKDKLMTINVDDEFYSNESNDTLRAIPYEYDTVFTSFDILAEESKRKTIVDPNIKYLRSLTQGNSSLQALGGTLRLL